MDKLLEENKRLRALVAQIKTWASQTDLDDETRRRLGSYTHAECGYEEAQDDVMTLIEDAS